MSSAQFVFQAVKGIQANMEYFVTMVPLDCLSKLFVFNNEELPPELRAQRVLNKARIPAMCDYIIKNPTSYVFSALTASVDGDILFTPLSKEHPTLGTITIDFSSKLLINDGQHRRAAIEAALKINPDLKYEHIPVVLYHDLGLKRAQQMFSDLNKFALRPTHSPCHGDIENPHFFPFAFLFFYRHIKKVVLVYLIVYRFDLIANMIGTFRCRGCTDM